MNKKIIVGLFFSGVMLMTNHVVSGTDSSKEVSLPKQYQLEDVKISVLHQTGHRLPGSYKITISGDGKALRVIDVDKKKELIFHKEKLLELLNEFYRIHYFEQQGFWTIKTSVALVGDNMVSTFSQRLVDMSSQRLCVEIADYKKCVTIMDEQPFEAYQLVKKIEDLFSEKLLINR